MSRASKRSTGGRAPLHPKTLRGERKTSKAPWVSHAINRLAGERVVDLPQPALETASSSSDGTVTQQEVGAGSAPAPSSAAATFLQADVRNRKVVLEELLRDFALGDSDAARCVRLAAAKLAYEGLYPDAAHGKNHGKRDPKSGSIPFWKYALAKLGGWKRATISRWCAIGEGLHQDAYGGLLGTPLANDLGRLEKLASLPGAAQVNVATKFSLKLEREGRDLLDRLWHRRDQAATPDEPLTDRPEVQGPPCDAREIEVVPPGFGILHDHIIGVTGVGDRVRLTFLGVLKPQSRSDAVAAEDWYDAVVRAAKMITEARATISLQNERLFEAGSYVAEVSAITWVPPQPATSAAPGRPAHHLVTVTCRPLLPLGDTREITVCVTRWESGERGRGTVGFGEGAAYDPYRTKLPVIAVTDERMRSPAPIPYDWPAQIEQALVGEFRRQLSLLVLWPYLDRRRRYAELLAAKRVRAALPYTLLLALLGHRPERVRDGFALLVRREQELARLSREEGPSLATSPRAATRSAKLPGEEMGRLGVHEGEICVASAPAAVDNP